MSCPAEHAPIKNRLEHALGSDDIEIPVSYYLYPLAFIAAVAFVPFIYRQLWLLCNDFLAQLKEAKNGPPPPKGCRRVGKPATRNLSREFAKRKDRLVTSNEPKVVGLFVYPIKSCYGVEVDEMEITRTGFKHDRQFCFAQLTTDIPKTGSMQSGSKWNFLTQRTHPAMTLIRTGIWEPDEDSDDYVENGDVASAGGYLVVSFPFSPVLDFSLSGVATLWQLVVVKLAHLSLSAEPRVYFRVPLAPSTSLIKQKNYPEENVRIWRDWPHALDLRSEVPEDALAKLKYFLGVSNPFSIFTVDAREERPIYKNTPTVEQIGYQATTGFADSYPISLQNMASIIDMEERVPKGGNFAPDARRYRANIHVVGAPAYSEDDWVRISIGDKLLHVSCRVTRCKLPNVNPDSAVNDPRANQPHNTMSKYRAIDAGGGPHRPCLGMHMVPAKASIGSVICLGDTLKVLKTGEHWFVPEATPEFHRPIF